MLSYTHNPQRKEQKVMGYSPMSLTDFMKLSTDKQIEQYNKVAVAVNKRIQRARRAGTDMQGNYPEHYRATQESRGTGILSSQGYFKKATSLKTGVTPVSTGKKKSKSGLKVGKRELYKAYKQMLGEAKDGSFTKKETKKREDTWERLENEWLKNNPYKKHFTPEEKENIMMGKKYVVLLSSGFYEEYILAEENGLVQDMQDFKENVWNKHFKGEEVTNENLKKMLAIINKEAKDKNGKMKSYYIEKDNDEVKASGEVKYMTQLKRLAMNRYLQEQTVRNNAEGRSSMKKYAKRMEKRKVKGNI